MKSNLVIDQDILDYMDEILSISNDVEFVLGVVKSEIEENPPGKWVFTIIPESMSDEMILNGKACRLEIEGREVTVYPISLLAELENKRLCWGEKEMELISNTYLESQLRKLHEVFELITARGKNMYEAYNGALYGVDFLAGAALNRTLANSKAFIDLIESRNLVIAGALLRIQLDTAMRFYAVFLVDKPHDFAIKILEGERLDLQKDRDGKKLSDRYLADKLNDDFPWVKRVYQSTSGYIHLSGTHIHHTMSETNGDFTVGLQLSSKDRDLPDELYIEAIEAFIESINILFKYVDSWIFTKENPDLVAEEKKRIEGKDSA